MNECDNAPDWASIDFNVPSLVPNAPSAATGGEPEAGPVRLRASAGSDPAAAAVTVVPPDPAAAALVNLERDRRATAFHDRNSGTEQAGARVGVPRTGSVPCRQCPARLEVSYLGYGDMVRRVEAAGWRYQPARHDRDRAWCPQCQNDAGSAAR